MIQASATVRAQAPWAVPRATARACTGVTEVDPQSRDRPRAVRLRSLPDRSAILPWRRSWTKLHGAQGCSLGFPFWPTGVPVSEGYPALAGRRDSRPGWMVAAVRSLATPTSPRPGPGDHSGLPSLPCNAASAALNSELVIGPDTPATQIYKPLNGGRIRDISPMPVSGSAFEKTSKRRQVILTEDQLLTF